MNAKREIDDQPIIISVDSYDDKVLAGRLWYGHAGSETKFTGFMQLLLLTEKALGKQRRRGEGRCKSFVRPDPAQEEPADFQPAVPTRGALATFHMRILFRQNTSWQGLLTWVDAKQEENFRSTLELAVLLDSALTYVSDTRSQ